VSRDRRVVTDTGPLIHLSEANALGLLGQFATVLVPETVFEELRRGGVPTAFEALDCERRAVDTADDRWPELDPGETAALTLCEQIGATMLTDDLDARRQANELGLEVHGSLGVVLVACADGRLTADEAKTKIRALERDSTLYLSNPLVERAIDRVDREEDDGGD
jgi:predicted nucleic acid-binding protein